MPSIDPAAVFGPDMTKGAVWFDDYTWLYTGGAPVDLTNYEISVDVFFNDMPCTVAKTQRAIEKTYAIDDGVKILDDVNGKFEIRIPGADLAKVKMGCHCTRSLRMVVTMTRKNSLDALTGYEAGESRPLFEILTQIGAV